MGDFQDCLEGILENENRIIELLELFDEEVLDASNDPDFDDELAVMILENEYEHAA